MLWVWILITNFLWPEPAQPTFLWNEHCKRNKSLVVHVDKIWMPKEVRCLKSTVKHHADTCSHITLNSAFLLVLLLLGTGNAFPFEQAMCLPGPPFFSSHQKELFYFQASFRATEDYTRAVCWESQASAWQAAAAQSGDRAMGQVPKQGRCHHPKSVSIWVRCYRNMWPPKKTPQL